MKLQSTFLVFSILTSTLIFSCKNLEKQVSTNEISQTSFDLTTAKKEIEAVNQNFMELLAKSDTIGIGNLYTKDAKLMFAGAPAFVGREKIQTAFSNILNSGITKVGLKTIAVFGTEDLLAEEGIVTIYVKDKVVAEEKSIVLWKKEDGKWKLFRDISNSNSK